MFQYKRVSVEKEKDLITVMIKFATDIGPKVNNVSEFIISPTIWWVKFRYSDQKVRYTETFFFR